VAIYQNYTISDVQGKHLFPHHRVQISRNTFFLFQLSAHIMLNTYITSYLLHVSVFVTPSSGRLFRYLLKTICFLECCCKMYNIPCFLIENAATMCKTICISSICILEIFKMLVKILNCDTSKSVVSCYLLCMLAIYVFTVSSCVGSVMVQRY
jgi:hypothetical protein